VKKKIITVTTGTRADYGLLRPVLNEISSSKKLDLHLLVTGMHLSKKYGLTIDEIKKDGFHISSIVSTIPKDDSKYIMSKTLGESIIKFSKIFKNIKPDINVILGDRDEMLASALAAYHMNIPNAHIHGGERSGGIDEYTRHAITKISNIHFAPTKKSKKRILKMGENSKFVFFTGSPAIDEVIHNKITQKKLLEDKYGFKFTGNEILFIQHSVTTQVEQTKKQIQNILKAFHKVNKPIIAISPNSDPGNNEIFKQLKSFSKSHDSFKIFKSLPRSDYLGMLKYCNILVGNSSSGIIEASYFRIPVVNIGERQKNREKGKNIFDVKGNSSNLIYDMIIKTQKIKKSDLSKLRIFGNGDSSKKITKYLENIKITSNLIEKQLSY
jgi:GDP/UDP-N,N'-diacetylbacillosamine 2-epimerase (hydrolysing)